MMVSNSYKSFEKEAPKVHKAWMETAFSIDKASTLDKKTRELAYLAVLAASRLESGLPFHVKMAKESGATRDEIISSILVGLPAVGNAVISSLPVALDAFDSN
jgi:alkylhydroperoxidase/carboxymuconolactone decarboxylase family protein YurZ